MLLNALFKKFHIKCINYFSYLVLRGKAGKAATKFLFMIVVFLTTIPLKEDSLEFPDNF